MLLLCWPGRKQSPQRRTAFRLFSLVGESPAWHVVASCLTSSSPRQRFGWKPPTPTPSLLGPIELTRAPRAGQRNGGSRGRAGNDRPPRGCVVACAGHGVPRFALRE